MSESHEPEVKIVERVEVTPAEDEEEETPADPDSSQDEEGNEPEAKAEEKEPEKPAEVARIEKTDDLKRVPGETDREYALRTELTKLRRQNRQDRTGEIFSKPKESAEPELSPEKKKILERYKPEEVKQVEELFGVIAEKQGYVKKDQLGAQSYAEKANDELSKFLDDHQEYLPENDPDSILWDRFKEEFNIYKQPSNPKDFKKIFNKAHEAVFGIKKAGDTDTKSNAAHEKVKVASHAGTSSPAPQRRESKAPSGLRTDMLKGFDEDFIKDLENGG